MKITSQPELPDFNSRKIVSMVFQSVAAAALLCTATAFASTTCNAHQMGAKADGVTKDTAAIQKAIDVCASKGGGTVLLQGGTFVSGPLDLKSHVALSVAKDTLLKASEEVDDFPVRDDAKWRRMALIHADRAEDIAITGEGTIDGSGQGWWTRHLNRPKGSPEPPRPMIVDITRSKKIRIEGVTIQNAPMYNILTNLCDGLTVRNVRILNPGRKAPNTDGIDPLSTSHVLIEHAYIDTGDDNVAIKSGLVERGEPIVPSRDITIRDCEFVHGHGLSIGSELAGGVQHVRVERVSFKGADQGIRIKSARGRGNDIGDFHYKDITMEDVRTAIQITGYYTGYKADDPGEPVTEHTPRFHDIYLENVTAKNSQTAVQIQGLPESPIQNIQIKNVHLQAKKAGVAQFAQGKAEGFTIQAEDKVVRGKGLSVEGWTE